MIPVVALPDAAKVKHASLHCRKGAFALCFLGDSSRFAYPHQQAAGQVSPPVGTGPVRSLPSVCGSSACELAPSGRLL
eukprot:8327481-Pyramimonas_sp.AAC.1